jgi:N-acetylglucosaminyldiphosphoundecaprenol N-acetyl-beta-D-mannosaminyltransferase
MSGIESPARTVLVGDLAIHDVTFPEVADWIWTRATSGQGAVVCTPNVDYVVRSRNDLEFRRAINGADLRAPDGKWVVYASRIAGRGLRETVTGRLLLPDLAGRAATAGVPIALFGAMPGIAARAASRMRDRHPTLNVTALSPPPQFVLGSEEDDAAVKHLMAAQPSLLFVALGAPKQELWMSQHRADFPSTVLIGVGAALDIVSGRFREAPRWMTNVGLEWLFRLAQEPRRLARRYLIDDPWILRWAIQARLGRGGDGS